MVYSIITPVQISTVDWGNLAGKGGYVLRVADDASTVTWRDMKTNFTNSTLNSDTAVLSHYDMSIVSYSGSTISAVTDQSGHTNVYEILNFIKSSTLLNGRYFADGNNTNNKYMTQPLVGSIANLSASSSFMFCFLVKCFTPTTSSYLGLFENVSGLCACYYDSTTWYMRRQNGTAIGYTTALNTSTWMMVSGGWDISNNTQYLFINGEQKAIGNCNGIGAPSTTGGTHLFTFGGGIYTDTSGHVTSGNQYNRFNGYVAEVAFISGYDNAKLRKIEGLFAYNFGLSTEALYSGHPFYGIQPFT